MLYNTYYLAQIHQILHNSKKTFQQTIQETEYSQLLFINKYNLYIKKFVVSSFRFLPELEGSSFLASGDIWIKKGIEAPEREKSKSDNVNKQR